MNIKQLVATACIAASLLAMTGCSAIAQLEENARADRAANPGKYLEDPEIKRAQMTQNQGGAAYPEFCTFGCTEPMDLTRNH
jgi:hypothetical protein